ncbi:hypothetical protein DRE_04644 [Drechslerella stenobrocha 248]|uniref:Uncharacterized protein n=1 Tax=Drechslerella stenobrocha 248 TaxID=1043628 RepID=W7IAJ4_9PEZI|nr:hypothetical protein DRE_04644 [Drechslerella stenobrocha 248]
MHISRFHACLAVQCLLARSALAAYPFMLPWALHARSVDPSSTVVLYTDPAAGTATKFTVGSSIPATGTHTMDKDQVTVNSHDDIQHDDIQHGDVHVQPQHNVCNINHDDERYNQQYVNRHRHHQNDHVLAALGNLII